MAGSKRERELARAKYERQQERRSQRAETTRRRTQIATSVVVAVLVVAGFTWLAKQGGGDATDAAANPTANPTASPSTPSAGAGRVGCLYTKAGNATKDVGLPPASAPVVPETSSATLTLNSGVVKIQLLDAKAPCTVSSFAFLAQAKYFDKTNCHRLTTSPTLRVLQCGDPTADPKAAGAGGPGYQFADENLSGATYAAGTVAMANAGPGTNGSQFFLVYGDSQLGPNYTPFGKITAGLDVLTSIAKTGVTGGGTDGVPAKPVTITSVVVAGS